MSIGKWIVVAFVLFAGFIATLVVVCMRQDISLVSKDYYKEELAYQQQITRINNTARLTTKPVVRVTNRALVITLDSTNRVDRGEVKLFCPSNARMDRTFTLNQDSNLSTGFDLTGLQTGMYRVKFSWTLHGKDFYHEEIINL